MCLVCLPLLVHAHARSRGVCVGVCATASQPPQAVTFGRLGAGPSGMRVSGATNEDGTHNERVNGDFYLLQQDGKDVWMNGRAVYQKASTKETSMWYAHGKWRVGSTQDIGDRLCFASLASHAMK